MGYQNEISFEKRRDESARMLKKYPDRVPIIVEKDKSSELATIEKRKYLTPGDLSFGQFNYVIRKRIKLTPEKAMFLFVGNYSIPNTAATVGSIYEEFKNDDGFLYITYSGENTFG